MSGRSPSNQASTDGTWFELYRNMLVQERENDSLLLLQATPRKWLEDGQQIRVRRAPTYYGLVNLTTTSHTRSGEIRTTVELARRKHPAALVLRLRHPQGKPIQSVSLNGKRWTDFDGSREQIRILNPGETHYEIVARY